MKVEIAIKGIVRGNVHQFLKKFATARRMKMILNTLMKTRRQTGVENPKPKYLRRLQHHSLILLSIACPIVPL